MLIDASQPLTEQDQRVLSMVIEAGRALVLAFNKWDLVDEDRRELLEREIDRELVQVRWAQRVNISAKTGRAVQKLVPAMETALASWDTRIADRPAEHLDQGGGGGHTAPGARGQAAADPVRHPGHRPATDVRAVHHRVFSRPATAGSWNDGCARRSGSRAARSGSTCGCARSGEPNAAERFECALRAFSVCSRSSVCAHGGNPAIFSPSAHTQRPARTLA